MIRNLDLGAVKSKLADPRAAILFAAVIIEAASLCLWPAVYLLSSSDGPSRFGEMFLQRYAPLGLVLTALKAGVDWVFPGALWTWERLVTFFLQCAIAAFAAYAAVAWRVTHASGDIRLRWVLAPLLVFQLTLVFVPGTMTTDIFNYALYGQMAALHGANPFVHTPGEFPQSPLYYLIPLYWHDAPSVYGPLWVLLSAGVASVSRSLPLADELLLYRGIANAAHVANVVLVWALANRLKPGGRSAPSAALAYGWNPLLLIDFALNGHNDVVMLTFALGAFLLGSYGRFHAGAVALGLSIAAKYTSALVGPVLLLWSARYGLGMGTVRGQIKILLGWSAASVAVVLALYVPWVQGVETLGPLFYWMTGPRLNNFWPEPALMSVAAWTAGLIGTSYDVAWDGVLGGFKLAAKAALAGWVLFEAWHARTLEGVLAASARVALVFLLVGNTWVMPWYYAWPLAFCAALGWQSALVRTCAGLTLTALVLMYQRQYAHAIVGEWAGLFQVLPLVLAAIPPVIGRLPLPKPMGARAGRSPLAGGQYVPNS